MRRYLSLYLPTWSTDIAARHLSKDAGPLVLVSKRSQQLTVMRVCPRGREYGVEEGMSLTFAKTLAPHILMRPFTPVSDFKELTKLASWCYRHISPFVGIDQELISAARTPELLLTLSKFHYGVTLDLTGTERLRRDEHALAKRIFSSLHKVRIRAVLVFASTIGAAWALSRGGNSSFQSIPPEATVRAISPLPLSALRLPEDTVAGLNAVGVRTVAELLKLPSSSLTLRYGALPHLRLDQALGVRSETLTTIRPEIPSLISRAFDPPLQTMDAIHNVAHSLLSALLHKLTKEGKEGGTYSLTIEEALPSGTIFTKTRKFTLHAPSTNLRHLSSLVTHIVDTLSVLGDVTKMSLGAPHTTRAKGEQRSFVKGETPDTIDDLLNAFVIHLGSDSVAKAQYENSYIPERSFSYRSVRNASSPTSTLPLPAVRPPVLLTPPEAAEAIAMLPDRPPSWIQWKGAKHKIVKGVGPERIGEEWWHRSLDGEIPHRDYFKVLDDGGRWLWIYRDSRTMGWFVHGVWS